jgi:hypothetical protein
MKTNPVKVVVRLLNPGSSAAVLLALPLTTYAVDALPLIDAPGPGYREQSARVMEPPGPASLRPISFMYPFMAPQPTFDGQAPEAVRMIPRGEFRLLHENPGWNFRVFDVPPPRQPEPALRIQPVPAPLLPVPFSGTGEAPLAPASPAQPGDTGPLRLFPK